ncbi:hypothetical protein FPHYL_8890 [Fusarium phyllophilum]|uniref:SET domain-containing protein n=1 Tax=Fusarium phyllophilum TaxID=47803 RepID=A0A8H5N4Z6_9HYPO|nr:hypothetical protein FPHYL_8890 [Fusarium phyllophilum]
MTANQSGRSDSEHVIQQSRPDEEVPVSTVEEKSPPATSPHDVEPESNIELLFKDGVFACRDLPQGHKITGEERPIFAAPSQPIQLPDDDIREKLNTTAFVCFDKFKRDHNCKYPLITNVFINSLAAHINHACPDCAQATFRVAESYDITVTLVKDVRAGDQICIDIVQARTRLVCSLCNIREPKWKWRKRQCKRFLAKLFRRNMLKTAEPPSE